MSKKERPVDKDLLDYLIDILKLIVISIIVALIIRSFILRPFTVDSGSMSNTLKVDDYVFSYILKSKYGEPKNGDIIIFLAPYEQDGYEISQKPKIKSSAKENLKSAFESITQGKKREKETRYVKRVIGVPGDVIDIKGNKVYLNDMVLNEPYLLEQESTEIRQISSVDFPYTVPKDTYFVMGDNRENSWDSRVWGPVPQENIIGYPVMIFYPFDRLEVL